MSTLLSVGARLFSLTSGMSLMSTLKFGVTFEAKSEVNIYVWRKVYGDFNL